MTHIAYIGIGSNLGDKRDRCERGVTEVLKLDRNRLLARSSLYTTQPLGYADQDWFVNLVIKIETNLDAFALFQSLKEIESRLGRLRNFRWGPRTIDLDILFFDHLDFQTEELTIPHPRVPERQFVLIPLAEIDPKFVHPVLRKTIQELLDKLDNDQGVVKLQSSL